MHFSVTAHRETSSLHNVEAHILLCTQTFKNEACVHKELVTYVSEKHGSLRKYQIHHSKMCKKRLLTFESFYNNGGYSTSAAHGKCVKVSSLNIRAIHLLQLTSGKQLGQLTFLLCFSIAPFPPKQLLGWFGASA